MYTLTCMTTFMTTSFLPKRIKTPAFNAEDINSIFFTTELAIIIIIIIMIIIIMIILFL